METDAETIGQRNRQDPAAGPLCRHSRAGVGPETRTPHRRPSGRRRRRPVWDVRQVGTAAGGSNGTLLFRAAFTTAAGAQERELVLRFLPVEGLFHAYDVAGQFNLQRALEGAGVPAPPQLWLDSEGRHLQRPGYVMAMVRGVGPPMTWMTSGVIAEATPDGRRRMTTSYVHTLAKLHALDWRALGLEWLEKRAEGRVPSNGKSTGIGIR